MSNLSEFDAAIVAAAEYMVVMEEANAPKQTGDAYELLKTAVQAKRDAQRPKCMALVSVPNPTYGQLRSCAAPAVQHIDDPTENSTFDRCADHKVTVTDL